MNLFSLILATITLLIQEYADYDKEEDHNKTLLELKRDLNFPRIKSFDFIVVGGGTAGSLVAARLSEKFNVLLLESGGNPVPATESQFFSTAVQTDPTINNIFKSVPQFNFSQENGGIIETDTGKMLGGSGSHNDNVYNRGSPYDYDNFAKITGDNTWMYKNVLKHYKNFERLTGELIDETQRTEFYGTRGPVTVETKMSPIMPAWIQSARELGYGVHDPNGNQTEGFTPLVMSMINGKRVSAYSAFIKPIQNSRPTLTVLTYSEVEQVLINSDKRAYGVLYRRHGIIQVAHASKEVIVCAGTISSPLLLMRSGIGSKEVLEKAKIPVLSDLKGVGRNFQNHGSVVLHYKVNNPNKTLLLTVDENDMETEVMKYLDSKPSGILTKTNYAQAFIASSRAKSNGEGHWPDLQVGFGQQPAIVKGALQAISSNIKVGRMKSSGVVKLNTTAYLNGFRDDLHLALIDHRAFSDSSDVDVLIEGIQLSLKIMETTTPFRKMGVQLTDTSPQKCGNLVFRSRDYWKCYIQQRGQVVLHLTGTCSMGPKTDPMAVVDSKLRVYGIWRLRVVDGSVMPRTPNSNTNAPVMLVAEKASQDILATYASK